MTPALAATVGVATRIGAQAMRHRKHSGIRRAREDIRQRQGKAFAMRTTVLFWEDSKRHDDVTQGPPSKPGAQITDLAWTRLPPVGDATELLQAVEWMANLAIGGFVTCDARARRPESRVRTASV